MRKISSSFVLNTMNTILNLCESDTQRCKQSIRNFSKVLQEVVCCENAEDVHTLEMEMNLVRAFVDLEKIRFGDRVEFSEDLMEVQCLVPAGIIYEVVHNAIEYRISKSVGGGSICIKSKKMDDSFFIEVSDKGKTAYNTELLNDNSAYIDGIKNEVDILCAGSVSVLMSKNEVKVQITLPDL